MSAAAGGDTWRDFPQQQEPCCPRLQYLTPAVDLKFTKEKIISEAVNKSFHLLTKGVIEIMLYFVYAGLNFMQSERRIAR